MKAPFDIAADLDTPVSAYRKLARFEPAFLLESAEGGERLGRYSFIGLGRALELVLDSRGLSVGGRSAPAPPDRDGLLAALRQTAAMAPALLPSVPGLPVNGGLFGFVGYDFVRRVEKVGPRTAPAAANPEPELAMVAPRSVLAFDHLTRRMALLHAGPEWERQSLRREVIEALRGPHPAPPTRRGHEPPTGSLSREEFVARVERVKEHIRAGDVFQLVLSVRYTGRCHSEPFEVYRALRLLNPSPYMYYLDVGGSQIVGSSPEALVRLSPEGVATLRPIAGTRPRGADEDGDRAHEADLLADPKEAAEHVMLVDLARNDLGRVAVPGSVCVRPYRSIERYSHVMHIVSGVSGRLAEGKDALDLFAATFPAGTVVGAPKVRAMQIIDELEPTGRGVYAGTVGYFGRGAGDASAGRAFAGSMDQAIAIRTITFRDGHYAYQAGAGIVADSDPEAEYREVRAKVGALEAALTLAEEGL